MPIYRQRMIYRTDLRANPMALFLFGDNMKRSGFGGQAKEMRGEPNACGIPTKWAPGREDRDYFSDLDLDEVIGILRDNFSRPFSHVRAGGLVIIPADGLGTGLSELPTRAPKIDAHLRYRIEMLEVAHDTWVRESRRDFEDF